jgi:RimJ/RimL family protein N-acetyltransferase
LKVSVQANRKGPLLKNLIPLQPLLRICHIQEITQFQRFETSIRALIEHYQAILWDDFSGPNPESLVSNLATYCPWLWLLIDDQAHVYAIAGFSDIIPNRHAFLHGVSHPTIRKNTALNQLGHFILNEAFDNLGLHKVKAEIEANNLGAKGFCRRMGFTREAHFRQDNRIGGQWQDVLVYSLFAEQFKNRYKPYDR